MTPELKSKLFWINHKHLKTTLQVIAIIIGFIIVMAWAGGTYPY